jgi:DNA-binding GntR family transcriptional regulator
MVKPPVKLRAIQRDHLAVIEQVGRSAPDPKDGSNDPKKAWQIGDQAFHGRIAAISGNEQLTEHLASIQITFPASLVWSAARDIPRMLVARSVEEHDAVLDALEQSDGERARIAMKTHLLRSGERVLEWFERESEKALPGGPNDVDVLGGFLGQR